MSTVLLIETATSVCSVALAQEGRVVARRESDAPNAHSTQLPLFVRDMLDISIATAEGEERGRNHRGIDAVCISSGPGSYTGLRIGVSTAKGLCYGLEIPLLSVPTLLGMANLYFMQHPDYQGLVCPMIDARRMECYTMIVQNSEFGVRNLRDTQADVITENIYDEWLDKGEVTFIGDGASKTCSILGGHPNARYDENFRISAEGMLTLADEKLAKDEVEDVAYFEPFYLKDFVAKKSVVHGLRN